MLSVAADVPSVENRYGAITTDSVPSVENRDGPSAVDSSEPPVQN